MKITLNELREAVGGRILSGSPSLCFENITTSSNVIKGNDLFVPIKGERTDGHRYIGAAFEKGAAASLTERREVPESLGGYEGTKGLVLTENTVRALQSFGAYFRKRYVKIPYVGITGSVGKTTTREMTAAALSAGMRTYSTRGNANSQIGVPVTVFETDPNAQVGVIELGISEFGEMERISRLAAADCAVITNIGVSHISQFLTKENILKEKLMILSGMPDGAHLFLNGDDPMLKTLTEERIHALGLFADRHVNIRFFGTGENCGVRAVNIAKTDGLPSFDILSDGLFAARVSLGVPGDHMIGNAAAAMTVALHFGTDAAKASSSLSEFSGFDGRGNLVRAGGVDFINDSYNASPASMMNGLSAFAERRAAGRKIAVLADMLELGAGEKEYHRQIGKFIADKEGMISELYVLGSLSQLIADEAERSAGGLKVYRCTDIEKLKEMLSENLREGDLVYLKGSNSMGLMRLIT